MLEIKIAVSKLSVLDYMLCHSTVKPHQPVQQLKAAKLEIRDLQAEFEVERDDYLATIRRLEREGQLLHSLLERMVPLVRRDCNYSNVDRVKKEAVWDEDSSVWRLPEVMVQKTTLPSGATCEEGI